jgi:hypothetical protein
MSAQDSRMKGGEDLPRFDKDPKVVSALGIAFENAAKNEVRY